MPQDLPLWPEFVLPPRADAAFSVHEVAQDIVDAGEVALAFGTQPNERLRVETDAHGHLAFAAHLKSCHGTRLVNEIHLPCAS